MLGFLRRLWPGGQSQPPPPEPAPAPAPAPAISIADLGQLKPFEIKGEWWRPDGRERVDQLLAAEPKSSYGMDEGIALLQRERDQLEGSDHEHACRGPLTFDPKEGLRLSLLGSSEVVFPAGGDDGYAVYGLTSTGRPCSLLDCFATKTTTQLFTGFADRTLVGNTYVDGLHVDSVEQLVLDHIVVEIPGMVEFLTTGTGLGDDQAERVVELAHGTITFHVGERKRRQGTVTTIEQAAFAEMRSKASLSYDAWGRKWIEPLARLITFANARPTVPAAVQSAIEVRGEDGDVRTMPVHVVQRQREVTQAKLKLERQLVFAGSFGDRFAEFVRSWWALMQGLEGTGDFLFGALRDPLGLEARLVVLGSVVESYDRIRNPEPKIPVDVHEEIVNSVSDAIADAETRKHYKMRLGHANEHTQQQRFVRVFRRAGAAVPELAEKAGRLASVVGQTRNYFVHLGPKSERVLEGLDLYEVNRLMLVALECNLLLDLDLAPDHVAEAVFRTHSNEPFILKLKQRGCAWPAADAAAAQACIASGQGQAVPPRA